MSIVAISQTLGSLGDEIGRELARGLGYEFADREIVLKAAERFGEGERELQHVTDEKPTLWERFTETKDPYLTYIEAIVREMAARDNVVLVGRGAPFVLAAVRHALRVRITAPQGVRAKRVETQQGITPEAAPGIVRASDRDRAARIKFLYQVDWDDALLYDLVLNTEHLATPDAVRIIREALHGERFQATPDSRMIARDLSLTAAAKAALLADPRTRELQLIPACRNGQLSVGGTVEREEQRLIADEVVGRIPGVSGVLNEIAVIPRRPPPAGI
jgi:cytidylate kinase